jgi:diguanylate cyclase (GGDEF)-like protein
MNSPLYGLEELAFKDGVTGLYNRAFFTLRLDEEVDRHRRLDEPVSLVLLHLDGWERINNQAGRAAGDQTLRAVGEILLKQTRGVNVVSRYDGALFAIVMVSTSGAGARLYVQRLRWVLASATFWPGHPVTARFGAAGLPEDGVDTGRALFLQADHRLRAPFRPGA